ncbi:uncharacterized protein LOC105702117 isoform X2 [Orussus abietinus]|uniref:uncharacterized protein LOC105702117 isoform X2 n=1 Tax=Orussus abietinus TaxID=222816 RepID=UPI00062500D2|nr:uncharacterized protein LOC105702117 isoform X2 [Orussus abietinus]
MEYLNKLLHRSSPSVSPSPPPEIRRNEIITDPREQNGAKAEHEVKVRFAREFADVGPSSLYSGPDSLSSASSFQSLASTLSSKSSSGICADSVPHTPRKPLDESYTSTDIPGVDDLILACASIRLDEDHRRRQESEGSASEADLSQDQTFTSAVGEDVHSTRLEESSLRPEGCDADPGNLLGKTSRSVFSSPEVSPSPDTGESSIGGSGDTSANETKESSTSGSFSIPEVVPLDAADRTFERIDNSDSFPPGDPDVQDLNKTIDVLVEGLRSKENSTTYGSQDRPQDLGEDRGIAANPTSSSRPRSGLDVNPSADGGRPPPLPDISGNLPFASLVNEPLERPFSPSLKFVTTRRSVSPEVRPINETFQVPSEPPCVREVVREASPTAVPEVRTSATVIPEIPVSAISSPLNLTQIFGIEAAPAERTFPVPPEVPGIIEKPPENSAKPEESNNVIPVKVQENLEEAPSRPAILVDKIAPVGDVDVGPPHLEEKVGQPSSAPLPVPRPLPDGEVSPVVEEVIPEALPGKDQGPKEPAAKETERCNLESFKQVVPSIVVNKGEPEIAVKVDAASPVPEDLDKEELPLISEVLDDTAPLNDTWEVAAPGPKNDPCEVAAPGPENDVYVSFKPQQQSTTLNSEGRLDFEKLELAAQAVANDIYQTSLGISEETDQFVSATCELFQDPSTFDFLLGRTASHNPARNLRADSLYVKFDPLVSNVSMLPQGNCQPVEEEKNVNNEAPEVANTPKRSPALAAIDKLLFYSPSPTVPPRKSEGKQGKKEEEPVEAPSTNGPLIDSDMTKELELVRTTVLQLEDQLQKTKQHVTEMEKQKAALEEKVNQLQTQLAQEIKNTKQMSVVVSEYEKSISRLLADKERDRESLEQEKMKLQEELQATNHHLSNTEAAFNDVHMKYERLKGVVAAYKSNETVLKESITENVETIKALESRYDQLKSHAMTQLEKANLELESIRKQQEAETVRLQAMVKKAELKSNSFAELVEQKTKENKELAKILDEVISRVGCQNVK